jgi:molecular chaperone DnaK
MGERHEPAVGIDLGTTFSAAACLDELGRPQTLTNAEGEKLTPSAVLFDGADTIVGKEAGKAIGTDAEQVASAAKRDVGQRTYHRAVGGRKFPPEVIEAWVLNKLRVDSCEQAGDYQKVVITVPAYFDETRRKATQDAGYMAGFEVMDIINEPTAAAVAFGFQHGLLRPSKDTGRHSRILVYDLGGGTFDVTVMEVGDQQFVALATDGDVHLGGLDWDQRLVDYAAEESIRKLGIDPRDDANAAGRLWRECEEAKRSLSARHKTRIHCDLEGQPFGVEVTRDAFEEITRDLLDRTAFTTRQTLQAAGLDWHQIDRVLCVGGSTRMPAVRAMLKQLSGREPECSVSPDEAVAHGAALHAGLLLDQHAGKPPRFQIRNVNSHSLGVVATESSTKRPRNAIVIPRNTPLPVAARRVFKTQKAAQKSILVRIVEGESATPADCASIGECCVRALPERLPAETPIEVAFRYEENGRLTVQVRVAGKRVQHEFARDNSLSQEQLDQWREHITGFPPAAAN